MSRPKAEYRVGVGASSIMMILVVLAMTALSLLSFSSAQRAEVMGKRSMMMTTAYYEAAAMAQQKLAVMDDILVEAGRGRMTGGTPDAGEEASVGDRSQGTGASLAQFLSEAFANRGLTDIALAEEDGEVEFSFSTDAELGRVVLVRGIINLDENPRYRITAHELVSLQMEDDGWEYTLWQGSDLDSGPIGDE